jgi:hypothetical protein
MTRHLLHFLRHDHSETPDTSQLVSIQPIDSKSERQTRDGSLFQVPVNMAVEEPRARIIRHEPDREVIGRVAAHARNVADDGVVIVVGRGSSAADHMEVVSVQVDGVLQYKV